MLPPELLSLLSGTVGAVVGGATSFLLGRNRPQADRQAGDASQIQALLASATYWEAQAKQFQRDAQTWQQEATDWRDRFYRGLADVRVIGQATAQSHQAARQIGDILQPGPQPAGPGKEIS